MSSEKESENLSRRKPKVSQARFVLLGLAGPKPRPKGVGDGQPVDIPAPLEGDKDAKGGRRWVCQRAIGLARSGPQDTGRQIRRDKSQSPEEWSFRAKRTDVTGGQENPLASLSVPVPQTNTGRWAEDAKARERTLVKELGNLAP